VRRGALHASSRSARGVDVRRGALHASSGSARGVDALLQSEAAAFAAILASA
jgi:hypothetical protein